MRKRKTQVSKTNLNTSTKREKVTSFISQQKSGQEFPPLVGKFIDSAKAEPLHLKNNAWQHWNSSALNYALSRSNLGKCDSIFDVPPNSCFGKYYHCIRFMVKATRLARKVRKWFAGDRAKNKQLEYRFTGKESRLFCHTFMSIVLSLKTDADQESHTFKLHVHVFAYTALNLRDSVSLFSRITISGEEVQNLQKVCSNFFRATSLFVSSTPTSWTIRHVVPLHAQQLCDSIGMGLGVNTVEGREAKHIALANFTHSTATDGPRSLGMNTSRCFGCGRMDVMTLFKKRLQLFTFQKDAIQISFAIVGNLKMLKMKTAVFILSTSE